MVWLTAEGTMNSNEETRETIQGRLKVLNKSIVSEQNSVQYYQTLLENTPEETPESVGQRRMYQDLLREEENHVRVIQNMIRHWESQLENLKA